MIKQNIANIYSITAPSIDKYLQLNGWKRDYNFSNENLMVFVHNKYYKRKIALPVNEALDGFYATLSGVLDTLAGYEKRQIAEIIKDILTTFVDRLEFRIISKTSEDGKLPIEYAASCIEGLKELILYSVCAEQSARPICFRATDFAKAYLEKFKLAQTEKGSFVINIDIQVVDENEQQVVFEGCDLPTPFEHKVVERISTAISQVDDIVQNKTQISKMAENAYETGITANMCEALLKMRPVIGQSQIDTTFRYASALTRQSGIAKKVDIQANHFYVIDELSKIYRDKTTIQEVSLTGIIRTLSKRKIEDGIEKTIRLYTIFEGRSRTVTIELNDAQYRIACDAHRDGKEVKVSGELDTSDRYWQMGSISEFSLLEINE